MKKLSLLLLMLISSYSFSIGSEYCIQISYTYMGDDFTSFVPVYWFEEGEREKIKDPGYFKVFFRQQYQVNDEVKVYQKIKDNRAFHEKACFAIQPYEYDENSEMTLNPKKMKDVVLLDCMERIAYGLYVLTELDSTDIDWISDECQMHNLGYDDIGCRLEVHSFAEFDQNNPLVKSLYSHFPKGGTYPSDEQLAKMKPIVSALKQEKIVVTMSCGC